MQPGGCITIPAFHEVESTADSELLCALPFGSQHRSRTPQKFSGEVTTPHSNVGCCEIH